MRFYSQTFILGREIKSNYRNENRGYQQLRVWQGAIIYYTETCKIFRPLPRDLMRVVCQQIASADSVHRNIAEGYCRRSVKEYITFLNYALGSLGESVSGLVAHLNSGQISEFDYKKLDDIAFKLENGLIKLVESLEVKRDNKEWRNDMKVS